MIEDPNAPPKRAVVVAVQLPDVPDGELESSVEELRQLAKTLGFVTVETFTQKRASFDSSAYVGVGKRKEIRQFVLGRLHEPAEGEEDDADDPDSPTRQADIVLVDHEISASQARNLERETGCAVMDRSMVILEIFGRHARSRAAKAQVEIAQLQYMAPRLREQQKLAGIGRQRSGTGGRGAGEKVLDLDRQKIRNRISELKRQIEQMELERSTQRARRQDTSDLARVALVGYTNAGKSTLMRALTGNEVLVADKLFATLDTTVRMLEPPTVPRILVTDTVGFIKNLPHALVASFKSTLDEALEADLLAHVVDAADPGFERQLAVTEAVLDEIGAQEVPRLIVFNKIDRVGDEAAQKEQEELLRARYPGCVVMSAKREGDVARLHAAIAAFFQKELSESELFLPWSAQKLRGEVFENCVVLDERTDDAGTTVRVRADERTLKRLREQLDAAGSTS